MSVPEDSQSLKNLWMLIQETPPEERQADDEQLNVFLSRSLATSTQFFQYSELHGINKYLAAYLRHILASYLFPGLGETSDERLEQSITCASNEQPVTEAHNNGLPFDRVLFHNLCGSPHQKQLFTRFLTNSSGSLCLLFIDRHWTPGIEGNIVFDNILLASFDVLLSEEGETHSSESQTAFQTFFDAFDIESHCASKDGVFCEGSSSKERPRHRKAGRLRTRRERNKLKSPRLDQNSDSESPPHRKASVDIKHEEINVKEIVESQPVHASQLSVGTALKVLLSVVVKDIYQNYLVSHRSISDQPDLHVIEQFVIALCRKLNTEILSRSITSDHADLQICCSKFLFMLALQRVSFGQSSNDVDEKFWVNFIEVIRESSFIKYSKKSSNECLWIKSCLIGFKVLLRGILSKANLSQGCLIWDATLELFGTHKLFHIMGTMMKRYTEYSEARAWDVFEKYLSVVHQVCFPSKNAGYGSQACCSIVDGGRQFCLLSSLLNLMWTVFAQSVNVSDSYQEKIICKLWIFIPCKCMSIDNLLKKVFHNFENRSMNLQIRIMGFVESVLWPLLNGNRDQSPYKKIPRRKSTDATDTWARRKKRRTSYALALSWGQPVQLGTYKDLLSGNESNIITGHLVRSIPQACFYLRITLFESIVKPYFSEYDSKRSSPNILLNYFRCLQSMLIGENNDSIISFVCDTWDNLVSISKTFPPCVKVCLQMAIILSAKEDPLLSKKFSAVIRCHLSKCQRQWQEIVDMIERNEHHSTRLDCTQEIKLKEFWGQLDAMWSAIGEMVKDRGKFDEETGKFMLRTSEGLLSDIVCHRLKNKGDDSKLSSTFNVSLLRSLVSVILVLTDKGGKTISPALKNIISDLQKIKPNSSSEVISIVQMLIECSVIENGINAYYDQGLGTKYFLPFGSSDLSSNAYGASSDIEEPLRKSAKSVTVCPHLFLLALDLLLKFTPTLHEMELLTTKTLDPKSSPNARVYENQTEPKVPVFSQREEASPKTLTHEALAVGLEKIREFMKNHGINLEAKDQFQVVNKIFKDLHHILSSSSPCFDDIRRITLEIWIDCTEKQTEGGYLELFWGLFKSEGKFVNLLLFYLNRMVKSFADDPVHIHSFGQLDKLSDNNEQNLHSTLEIKELNQTVTQPLMNTRLSQLLHKKTSCVTECSISCPIPRNLDWTPYTDGVSVCFWIKFSSRSSRLNGSTEQNEGYYDLHPNFLKMKEKLEASKKDPIERKKKIHLVSIGRLDQIFSLWIDGETDTLFVSNSSNENDKCVWIDEKRINYSGLRKPDWHHVAFVIPKVDLRKPENIQIKVIINSLKENTVSLNVITSSPSRQGLPAFFFLGQKNTEVTSFKENCATCIGNIFLFRSGFVTRETCLLLMALGKNAANISVPKPEDLPILLSSFVNKKLIESSISLTLLFSDPTTSIRIIQASLLALYKPSKEHKFLFYHCIGPLIDAIYDVGYPKYEVTRSLVLERPFYFFQQTVSFGLKCIGGVSQLAFMLGRVIECGCSIQEILDGLKLFLKMCHKDPELKLQLRCLGGYGIIFRLFSNLFKTDAIRILQVFLESCFGRPVLRFRENGYYEMDLPSDLILRNSLLFEDILTHWSYFFAPINPIPHFSTPCEDVETPFGVVCKIICYIISNKCHYGLFNHILLRSIDTFGKIVRFLKELKLDHEALCEICSSSWIVDTLMGLARLSHSNDQLDTDEVTLSRDDLNYRGISPPELFPDELNELNAFLLFLQPDMYSFISIHLDNAYYLSQMNFTNKQAKAIDAPNLVELADGTKELSSQFESLSTKHDEETSPEVTFGPNDDDKQSSTERTMESEIIAGVLNKLSNYFEDMGDSRAVSYFTECFDFDLIAILCGNPDIQVRTAVLKISRVLIRNMTANEVNYTVKRNSLYLLSHQLARFPEINEEILSESLRFAMPSVREEFFGRAVSSMTFDSNQQFKLFLPLLSLMPYTPTNMELCHITLTTLCHILKQNEPHMLRFFHKTHVLDSLVLTLHNCVHYEVKSPWLNIVIDDLQEILCFFAVTFSSFHLHQAYLTFLELAGHLSLLTRNEARKCGLSACCARICWRVEVTVLNAALFRLKAASESVSMKAKTQSTAPFTVRRESDNFKLEPIRTILNIVRQLRQVYSCDLKFKSTNIPHIDDLWQNEALHRNSDSKLTQTAVTDRFKVTLQKCFDLVFLTGAHVNGFDQEELEEYCLHLMGFLNHSLAGVVNVSARKSDMSMGWLKFAVQEPMKVHFIHLFLYLTSPKMNFATRKSCLALLCDDNSPSALTALELFKKKTSQHQNLERLAVFLHELQLRLAVSVADQILLKTAKAILTKLQTLDVNVLPAPKSLNSWSVVGEETTAWNNEIARIITIIQSRNSSHDQRMTDSHTVLFENIKLESSKVSEKLTKKRDFHVKSVLASLSQTQELNGTAVNTWRTIITASTHEQAVWYFPNKYPGAWKIDETEGPNRTRVRLTRTHLAINPKLFKSHTESGAHVNDCLPLESVLFGQDGTSFCRPSSSLLKEGESIVHSGLANLITMAVHQKGELLIGELYIYFIGGQCISLDKACLQGVVSKLWSFDSISEIHPRRYELEECALEIFTTTGESFLLSFETQQERDNVMGLILSMDLPNYSLTQGTLSHYTNQWREGHLTNFQYLTCLNKLAGRTLNDLMQYPVFPFVLSKYDGETIDLRDESIYRNLSRPIPAQDSSREKQIQSHYHETMSMNPLGGYHYSSHYSNSVIVLYYLVRLPPFTELFLQFQGNRFDAPDRTFHNIESTWQLATRNSTTAVRELIPELFYLPEMFVNSEGFEFGTCQNGESVDNVKLPPWAKGSPRNFVLVHRCALESAYVTRHLSAWIDLIFGFKQRGKAAVISHNVFHPATYSGNGLNMEEDPLILDARKTMIRTYGQTPLQIFVEAHPSPYLPAFAHNNSVQAPSKLYPEIRGIPRGTFPGSGLDKNLEVTSLPSLGYNPGPMVSSRGEVIILPENTVMYSPTKASLFVIQWGTADGVVRFKRIFDFATRTLFIPSYYNEITCCAVNGNQVWCGTSSGQILVYLVSVFKKDGDLGVNHPKIPLMGHRASVASLCLSPSYKLAISGSTDGKICMWDTNQFIFIRSLSINYPVHLLTISPTLGDWVVSCGDSDRYIKYYTINAFHIGDIKPPSQVTALAFSSAQEGRNINVVAVALQSSEIRFYSTWTLEHVRTIVLPSHGDPAVQLLYMNSSNFFFVLTKKLQRMVYHNNSQGHRRPKMFIVPPF